jgi:hypothetical protein
VPSVIGADALEDARAVIKAVAEYVDIGVVPWDGSPFIQINSDLSTASFLRARFQLPRKYDLPVKPSITAAVIVGANGLGIRPGEVRCAQAALERRVGSRFDRARLLERPGRA